MALIFLATQTIPGLCLAGSYLVLRPDRTVAVVREAGAIPLNDLPGLVTLSGSRASTDPPPSRRRGRRWPLVVLAGDGAPGSAG